VLCVCDPPPSPPFSSHHPQELEKIHVSLMANQWQTLLFECPPEATHLAAAPRKHVIVHFRAFGGDYGIGVDVEEEGGTRAVVSSVAPQMWGSGCPVSPGDKLLSINGVRVEGHTASQIRDMLYTRVRSPLTSVLLQFEVV
jgi:hypothetical protein